MCTNHHTEAVQIFGSGKKDMRQTTKPLLKRCRPFKYNKSFFLQRTMAPPSTTAWRLLGFSFAWKSCRISEFIIRTQTWQAGKQHRRAWFSLGGNTVRRVEAEMHGSKGIFLCEPTAEQTYLHLHALTENKYVGVLESSSTTCYNQISENTSNTEGIEDNHTPAHMLTIGRSAQRRSS